MATELCLPLDPSKSSKSVALDTAFVPPVGRWRAVAEVARAAWRAVAEVARAAWRAVAEVARAVAELARAALFGIQTPKLALLQHLAFSCMLDSFLPVFFSQVHVSSGAVVST